MSGELHRIYNQRARREAEEWSAKLDASNARLAGLVPLNATASVAPAALAAVAQRTSICGDYGELLRIADKYSQWAYDARLPEPLTGLHPRAFALLLRKRFVTLMAHYA